MSFYDVIMNKYPDMRQSDVAKNLGVTPSRLYAWRLCSPALKSIIVISDNTGMDAVELAREAIEDARGEV